MVTFWTGALHVIIAPVVTTTSITLSSNKIQNGDILVPANSGPLGQWLLKRRERSAQDGRNASSWLGRVVHLSIPWLSNIILTNANICSSQRVY